MTVGAGCLVGIAALLVSLLGVSVLKVDLDGVAKKKRIWVVTSCFGFQVMLGGSLCVSGPFKLQISCGIISKIS